MEVTGLRLTDSTITGDISVEPVSTGTYVSIESFRYLIMGPTGAGKSTFIEALAGESQKLSISKDQLAGYTQNVTVYQLVNVFQQNQPVLLVDTPGFSDTKISEIEIIDMVRKWLKAIHVDEVWRILYLIPITETRLAGSRLRSINMLKALLTPNGNPGAVIFVTTMWDTLCNERLQTRAESNFAQLRDEMCKGFFGTKDIVLTRFMNTRPSALQVMGARPFQFTLNIYFGYQHEGSLYLYRDLHERIIGALQQKHIIQLDMAQHEAQTNVELRCILEGNQREVDNTLNKFIQQLVNFGLPPTGCELPPPGCGHAHQQLRKLIAASVLPVDGEDEIMFREWKWEPRIPDDVASLDWYINGPSRMLSLKYRICRLLHDVKRRGSKWFKGTQ
ncbi:P-loop containing nucleoside triphosphate hydrolase protein [Panaeolus papilionaceus]|nr:P-loop containing nucleoside triphosphate hydrolase protein [Panaeolus papilionaceus]